MREKDSSNGRQYSSVQEFKKSIEQALFIINRETIQHFVSSLETRIYEVMQKHE